jgi:hypothetical protein
MENEEKIETTIENPVEEETTVTEEAPIEESTEETSSEDQETSNNPEAPEIDDMKAQRDRLYARLKKEEEKRKDLEKKFNEVMKEKKTEGTSGVDLEDLAERLSALQGLDSAERARLLKEADIQGSSLGEARKSEDFKFWRSSYRAKVKKGKTLEPSTKQSITSSSPQARVERFRRGEMSIKEKAEFLREIGVTRDYSKFGQRPEPRLGAKGSIRPPGV